MIQKAGYSFSTMWNIRRHSRGEDMIEEIRSLGFDQVELNYNVTSELMKTITPLIEKQRIQVSSVHNVFPFIEDKDYDTDSMMLGFDDLEKRKRSVELLLGSVDYAYRFGAKGVVVHPGEVPFSYHIDAELKRFMREHGKESEQYQTLWAEMMDRRNELAPIHVKRIQESLDVVCNYIAQKNLDVKIGIETRSRCNQIPTLQEANQIIDNLHGAPVYLWYDIGHGMLMEGMGLYNNVSEIKQMKDKVLGVHIHETVDMVDHWCPYIHSEDNQTFDHFLEIIDAATIKVYELRAPCKEEQIEASYRVMAQKINEQKGTWHVGSKSS